MEAELDLVLRLYRTMAAIRLTEERLAQSHQAGLVHGACHTYVGEEAVATGVCAHLTMRDSVFSTHRGHGHALAKGVPMAEVMAELYGRELGCSQGRGGSMHLFKPEVGLMGTSGIVGPCILQATGAGYSSKLMKTGAVGVAFFGDGASNNGAFHEGLNLAAIYKLPVLFVCENNMYATEVPMSYAAGNTDVYMRAAGYNIPGIKVDGNNVLAVYEAAGTAIKRARAGEGPTLLECKTYRTRVHAEGMKESGYRPMEEIAAWKARDPLKLLREQAMRDEICGDPEFDEVHSSVAGQVAAAHKQAVESPYPEGRDALSHVYYEVQA